VKIKSTAFFQILAFVIAIVTILLPALLFLFTSTESQGSSIATHDIGSILVRTLTWSLSVGILATLIGWFVGLRIATLHTSTYSGIVVVLLMSLAIPAYAIYYAWWQAWPAGTWFHEYVVQHGLLGFTMKTCLFFALVGWSWPIPALLIAMSNRFNNGLTLLHMKDGASMCTRITNRLHAEKKLLIASVILVSAITATNTTCFDLAQVATIGNELRAVLASNGSVLGAPWLTISGIFVAAVASVALLRLGTTQQRRTIRREATVWPIVILWILLTGGPLLLSALSSLGTDGFQLWTQYKGDLVLSIVIAISVGCIASLIVVSSMTLHLSSTKSLTSVANGMDFIWIFVACLPASVIASVVGSGWHVVNLDFIDHSPVVLVLALVAKVGFVGSLAGRWIASCPRSTTLYSLDSTHSVVLLCRAMSPRLLQGICITFAISIAMSFGEVALTSQLAPPSSNQPISIALLNAMHYQRPQIVTSALFLIVAVAIVGCICVVLINRKIAITVVLLCTLVACHADEKDPILHTVVMGSAGRSDNHFMTPRAIDANEDCIVVIDKTGRLQTFSGTGQFQSSWDLELSGTGYPTGVSIDNDGNIWIADTHQHRVLVLDSEGTTVLTFGSYGTEDGQFLYPTDIAFGLQGEVYVSEYGGNDRINVFDRSGTFIRSIGGHGDGRNEFRRPQSIVVDQSTGDLYVADSGNHRIVVLDRNGEVIRIISEVGREPSKLLYPYGLLFDTPDTLLVCEFGNNRLQRFSTDGKSLGIWGSAGSEMGLLRTPWGVAATSGGIVIADTGNNRLQLLPYMMLTNQ